MPKFDPLIKALVKSCQESLSHILADFTLIRSSSVFVVECHLKIIFFMLGFRNCCKMVFYIKFMYITEPHFLNSHEDRVNYEKNNFKILFQKFPHTHKSRIIYSIPCNCHPVYTMTSCRCSVA